MFTIIIIIIAIVVVIITAHDFSYFESLPK